MIIYLLIGFIIALIMVIYTIGLLTDSAPTQVILSGCMAFLSGCLGIVFLDTLGIFLPDMWLYCYVVASWLFFLMLYIFYPLGNAFDVYNIRALGLDQNLYNVLPPTDEPKKKTVFVTATEYKKWIPVEK